MNITMTQVYKHVAFSKQDWPSDGFELRDHVFQKMSQRKCETSIVERGRNPQQPLFREECTLSDGQSYEPNALHSYSESLTAG